MKKLQFALLFLMTCFLIACQGKSEFTIENNSVSRTLSIADGHVKTISIKNKLAAKELDIINSDEFRIRISKGTHIEGTDIVLKSSDFNVDKVLKEDADGLSLLLSNDEHDLQLELNYETCAGKDFMRKYLKVITSKDWTLERIDVDCIELKDIYQPYQEKQITAWGPAKWRPGLGQPLYTKETASYWGVEFPASYNYVEDQSAYCGYLCGKNIKEGTTYTTYKSVLGVGDDAAFVQDAFFAYIDEVRIRPLRLQVQYNSWFDFWSKVTRESFAGSVKKVSQELNEERQVPPLSAFVIDDGWQNSHIDWSDKVWKVNEERFDKNLESSKKTVNEAKSQLGLWLSPGCNFGARPAVPLMRKKGMEALDEYMSLAGPQYMQLLEDRMLELTEQGVSYFKLDGLFGHLNRREFDLEGGDYMPRMPQLDTNGFKPADERLNDPKYDELKSYYLVAGSERLMEIFKKQHKINPEVYIVISNGAYLSPWWLMYIDAVWMINAGDAAGGSNRTEELVYRDGVYYDTWVTEKTQFPINSVFNHEPKKTKTGESREKFSEYLWMNLSRGTGFVELYIVTNNLSEADWDVLADGLKWAHKAFPYFKLSRMHGGNPKKKEVYGYSGWNQKGGYISFHNPSNQTQTYRVKLDRQLGLIENNAEFTITSPLHNAREMEGKTVRSNGELEISLTPGEVKVLDFVTR
ncbi:MAG: alpha-galactosidase [Carboxylicivirga sp.]|jgi:hypothetical protein|nr:alpha-galactosidase [Carboxylicivirga sp.]